MSCSGPFCCITADTAVPIVQILTITLWNRAPQSWTALSCFLTHLLHQCYPPFLPPFHCCLQFLGASVKSLSPSCSRLVSPVLFPLQNKRELETISAPIYPAYSSSLPYVCFGKNYLELRQKRS